MATLLKVDEEGESKRRGMAWLQRKILDAIQRTLSSLTEGQQLEVLGLATRLAKGDQTTGVPGSALEPFYGIMEPAEVGAIMEAVDNGCKKVDSEW